MEDQQQQQQQSGQPAPDQQTSTPAPPPERGETPPDTNGGQAQQSAPAWLPDRLERERNKARQDLLADLGIDDVDTLKAALQERQTLRQQQMSELEQVQDQAQTLQSELQKVKEAKQEAEAELERMRREQLDSKRRSAVLSHASNALHPEDVLAWIEREYPDEFASVVDSDGNTDEKKAKGLVDKCIDARRAWFRTSTNPGSPPSANRGHAEEMRRLNIGEDGQPTVKEARRNLKGF